MLIFCRVTWHNKDIKKQDCPEQIHYIVLLVLTVCKCVNSCDHTVQDGVVMFDKLPSTFDTWFGVHISWIFINNT